ncbi:MAG: hypothetical protein HY323_12695 [Betaproteobacteria bacterium]|nr:hypothetical protein [Betaproteobacteria bacterium]
MDKQQIALMLDALSQLPQELGAVSELLADSGYCSAENVEHCEKAGIEPLIATGREAHHLPWQERFAEDPPPLPESADALQRMSPTGC